MSSDHFSPWSERQGESGFAWSFLGAALATTSLPFGVVNAPGQRYHPAIVAQAASTLEAMYPGRTWLGLGSVWVRAAIVVLMKKVSISAAKAELNELVEDVGRSREHITFTKHGAPVAVMVSADEWESIQETLFWQSQPGIRDDLAQAEQDVATGDTVSAEEVRARYGLPPVE